MDTIKFKRGGLNPDVIKEIDVFLAANYAQPQYIVEETTANFDLSQITVEECAAKSARPQVLSESEPRRPQAFGNNSAPFSQASGGHALKKKRKVSVQDAVSGSELDNYLETRDESFSEMLIRKIAEKDIKDSDCYNRAQLSRQVFNKIINDSTAKASKPTVLSLAIALELDIDEAKEFLQKAGYAFSPSEKFDLIVRYFIENGVYDIFIINEYLLEYDQRLLGSASR